MNKLIRGDALSVIQHLDSKSARLVLTDVPYDLCEYDKQLLHDHFCRIAFGTVIVFSPPENQWILPADEYLFWEKPISTKNTSRRYSRFVEMMFVYHLQEPVWDCSRHWSQYTNVFKDLVDNSKIHAFRKPPSLIERLIRNHTRYGDLVVDPFMGSGVIGQVCAQLGRNYIGVERDHEIFAQTYVRLEGDMND